MTEQKRRRAELAAVNQELEAFSYSVSHDLRAPLRHVSGFAEPARAITPAIALDDEGRRATSRRSSTPPARMGRLIDDLLAFSRIGRTQLERSARRPRRAVVARRAARSSQPDADAARSRGRCTRLPEVDGDPALLRLVFVNLLSNAVEVHAAREHCRRSRSASQPSDAQETVVFVRDNGVGFDMQYADKLFGVFQRLHSVRRVRGHRHRPGQRPAHHPAPRRPRLGRRRRRPRRDVLLLACRDTDGAD